MLLLATVIALFAERLAPQLARHRSLAWFEGYVRAVAARLRLPGWLFLIVLLAPWALLVYVLQDLLHGVLGGVLELAFSVVVLFLALRPGSVDPAVDHYLAARAKGEDGAARHYAEQLLGGSAPQAVDEEVRAVADALLSEANERWVAPLVWFVLFGPLGALVYRLTVQVEQQEEAGEGREAARLLRAALDWLPARLLAAMYILSGSFEDGLNAWRQPPEDADKAPPTRALALEHDNRALVLRVGRAALRAQDYGVTIEIGAQGEIEADASIVRAARALVLRSLIAIVAIIALLTLGGLIA